MSGATAQELAVRTAVATVADTATLLQKVDSPGRLYAPITKTQLRTDLGLAPENIPVFAGLDVGSLSGIILGTDGVLSAITDNSSNWDDAHTHSGLTSGNPHSVTPTELSLVIGANTQAWDASLDSIAGLGYVSASFIKKTGADTYVLRTIGETANDLEGTIDHNLLANYDANKHVDHTGVSISAGTGLTGGGTIAASRTLALDIPGLVADATPDSAADYVLTYDDSASTHKKVLLSDLPGGAGDVTGPVSSTDHAIVRWDGAAGDTLLDSNVTISDAGLLTTDTEGVGFLGIEYATGADVWASPTGISDPTSTWESEGNMVDENESSYGWRDFSAYGWGYRLEFTVPACSCDKVRILGSKNDDAIQVRGFYYDGSWHQVGTISLPAAKAWVELSLGAVRSITKFKFEFQTTQTGNSATIYEVEYNDFDEVDTSQYSVILKAGEPHAALTFTLPIVDGSANEALKTNASGVLSWGGHDDLADFAAGEHFLQTAITNVSTGLSTGLLKVTTGSGALSVLQTDITGAELEELSDGSETTLHSHAGGGGTFLDLSDTPASYDSADVGYFLRLKDDLSGLEFAECAGGGGGGGFGYTGYIKVSDTKAQNTPGGTFTSGAWRTRDLSTEDIDTNNDCSLASNQITLAAGTYECLISTAAYKVSRHQLRLYNTTGAAVILLGTTSFANETTNVMNHTFIVGRFTIAADQALEVQHRCEVTLADYGYGIACNFTSEVYTVAEFWRVADGVTFLNLSDTPADYSGQAGKYAKVNAGENGLEFDTPAGAFSSRISVWRNGNQTITTGVSTKVAYNAEINDNDNEFDTTANRFTADAEGWYHITAQHYMWMSFSKYIQAKINKNGAIIAQQYSYDGEVSFAGVSQDVYLDVDDYIEIEIEHNQGGNRDIVGVAKYAFLTIHRFA